MLLKLTEECHLIAPLQKSWLAGKQLVRGPLHQELDPLTCSLILCDISISIAGVTTCDVAIGVRFMVKLFVPGLQAGVGPICFDARLRVCHGRGGQ